VDTLFDKERVFDLSLVDEHINHHFHFVTALGWLALGGCLLLHGVHSQLLARLESRKGL